MAEPAVEFRSVSKGYDGGAPALSSLTLSVDFGETLVLLGSSGSGKTTMLKMINHLVEADSGEVIVEGREVRTWDPVQLRRNAGYVIQNVGLLPHWSVIENIELLPRLEGWSQSRRRERARELLGLVGLEAHAFEHKRPSELSGGERQRVGVARALAIDPPILLMDEPFGALDPITRRRLQDEFRKMSERLGKTIVFVTHDVTEAIKLAHRIGVMHRGELLQLATPETILRDPANEFVRELVRTEI